MPAPRRRRGAGGGGTGLSQRAACCSPAHRLCSVTQHSLTAPSPITAASSPSPGGNTRSPPSPCPPTAPQPPRAPAHRCLSPPQDHQHRQGPLLEGQIGAVSDGEQGGGHSACTHHPCRAHGSIWIWPFPPKAPYGIRGDEHQLLLWHLSRHWEKGFGVLFLGDWTERDVRSHRKVWRFFKGFFEPHVCGVWSLTASAYPSISVHIPCGRDLEVTSKRGGWAKKPNSAGQGD